MSSRIKEVKMLYRQYKRDFKKYDTKEGSYNAEERTVIVILPASLKVDVEELTEEEQKWRSIEINSNSIEKETEKACLIKCPNKSEYSGFVFWHPARLVKRDKFTKLYRVSFTTDFEFKLKKYGSGKWNKAEVVNEKTISAEEFLDMYEGHVCEYEYDRRRDPDSSYHEVKEPEKIDIDSIKVEVIECLKNNL